MNAPGLGQYIVVTDTISPSDVQFQTLRVKLSLINKQTKYTSDRWATTTLTLLPGEWYQIKNIIYGPKSGTPQGFFPTISLHLHKTKPHRKWVRKKIDETISDASIPPGTYPITYNIEDFDILHSCRDLAVYCQAQDMKHKVLLVDSVEEALLYSNKILGKDTSKLERWTAIVSD